MKIKGGYTPTEKAYDIAIGWLRSAYKEETGDVEDAVTTESQRKAVKAAIAKLHNRLLRQSKMDGVEI